MTDQPGRTPTLTAEQIIAAALVQQPDPAEVVDLLIDNGWTPPASGRVPSCACSTWADPHTHSPLCVGATPTPVAGRVPSPWEDAKPGDWTDVHDILWDILTSFDMHGAVARGCADYILSPSSGLIVKVEP